MTESYSDERSIGYCVKPSMRQVRDLQDIRSRRKTAITKGPMKVIVNSNGTGMYAPDDDVAISQFHWAMERVINRRVSSCNFKKMPPRAELHAPKNVKVTGSNGVTYYLWTDKAGIMRTKVGEQPTEDTDGEPIVTVSENNIGQRPGFFITSSYPAL